MASKAVDVAHELAEDMARDQWQQEVLGRLQTSQAELDRLTQLMEFLNGPLASICDKAAAFADQQEDLPDIVSRAIAADPSLSQVLHGIDGLKLQFHVVQNDIQRLAQNQEDAKPVYTRMNRVADYFDELWVAGVKPKQFAHCFEQFLLVIDRIGNDDTADVDEVLLDLRTATPKAASVCVLEAAAATRSFQYVIADKAMKTAVRLKPDDQELIELSRRVTDLATNVTPKNPTPRKDSHHTGQRLQLGDSIDGWLLETRLGAGGWGQVFKATRDGQTRAIKVMHPEYASDRAFVDRFLKEIETLIKLPRHDNLVQFGNHFFCPHKQTWYLSMEYIEGWTLESYLEAKGPLTEGQVRKLFLDLVGGLAEAHSKGLVHRDIKPSNLIVRKDDQKLVLVDFGLAVGVEDFGHTRVGGISVQFAAPEQHYGDPATQASDVFCLCAVMHYALHYDKPEVRKPNGFTENLAPPSLRDAIVGGMKINVAERFRNATDLFQALSGKSAIQPRPSQKLEEKPFDPVTEYAQWNQQIPDRIERGQVITNRLGMKFAAVPLGRSWLGGGGGILGSKEFVLEKGLYCGVYPVTQAEWQAVMGYNPSHFQGNPRYPVEMVSWNCVQTFLEKLNEKNPQDGLLYRLPTEQEWEYICRGAPLSSPFQSQYDFYFARSKTDLSANPSNDLSSTQANFNGNYPAGSASKGPYLQRPSDVGSYLPNPLGIYDMHGLVWEWTQSTDGASYLRVIRGGSWLTRRGVDCTASSRSSSGPTSVWQDRGFRILAVPTKT